MKNRIGVILLVFGVAAVVVAIFPKLGGVTSPEPGFGPWQIATVVLGGVLIVVGLVLLCAGGKKGEAAEEAGAPAEAVAAAPAPGEGTPDAPATEASDAAKAAAEDAKMAASGLTNTYFTVFGTLIVNLTIAFAVYLVAKRRIS